MPATLIALGVVLIIFTFLLAFTIFGVIAAVAGIACIAIGVALLGRRSSEASEGQQPR